MCSIQTFLILLVKFGAQLIYATVKLISWHLSFCSQRGCREAPGLLTCWFATDDTFGFQSTCLFQNIFRFEQDREMGCRAAGQLSPTQALLVAMSAWGEVAVFVHS